jgi:hypothetical protein
VPMMVTRVELLIEVVGCPTVCRHCWAQGVPYQAMPLGDAAWVLEQAHQFCEEHGLGFYAYPMHEVAAHPQAAAILRLFADHVGAAEFEPLATTGVPLATREDWKGVLAAAAELGTTSVWVAFHGIGVQHDRQVDRPGAYAETCLAIQRVHAVGLRVGCTVFVAKPNAPQAERLLGALQRLEIDGMSWEPATYYPTARGRRNERLRPELAELLPLATRIRALSPFHHDAWANLEAHTEAAWARRALAGDWPSELAEMEPRHDDQGLRLVCRPGLELRTGSAGLYRERHGNLRTDVAQIVFGRALQRGGWSTTRCGSGWTRCLQLASWPPNTATEPGRGLTSPKRRSATCGWTGRSGPGAPPRLPADSCRPSCTRERVRVRPDGGGWGTMPV